jgi:hypothetical protein
MRDRLKLLIDDLGIDIILTEDEKQHIADYLINSGVIVPLCKVGDMVYTINKRHPKKWKVHFIGYNSQGEFKMHIATEKFTEMLEVWDYAIGKTVFLTRKEAEKALERSDNG